MVDTRTAGYSGTFDGRLSPGIHPALVVIDVCGAYLMPEAPLYAPQFLEAMSAIEAVLAAARALDMMIVHSRVVYQKGGADGGLFYRKIPALRAFDEGSPFGDFPDSVRPRQGEVVVTKQYASAFFGTSLAATLNASRIDSIILCGFSTSGCVRATATDALQFGFAPFVVREACADRHSAVHEANLFDLQSKYAEVISVNECHKFMRSTPS